MEFLKRVLRWLWEHKPRVSTLWVALQFVLAHWYVNKDIEVREALGVWLPDSLNNMIAALLVTEVFSLVLIRLRKEGASIPKLPKIGTTTNLASFDAATLAEDVTKEVTK